MISFFFSAKRSRIIFSSFFFFWISMTIVFVILLSITNQTIHAFSVVNQVTVARSGTQTGLCPKLPARKRAVFVMHMTAENGDPQEGEEGSSSEEDDKQNVPPAAAAQQNSSSSKEEILFRIHFVLEVPSDIVLEELKESCRGFPFAAVLPVQPMTYRPTEDGVEIEFLRKPTEQKSGVDGGIRISVLPDSSKNDDDDGATTPISSILLTGQRNSQGQVIEKLMAEKLVTLALVEHFVGGKHGAKVSSIYHKWMQ